LSRFRAATRISRLNWGEIAGDRPSYLRKKFLHWM